MDAGIEVTRVKVDPLPGSAGPVRARAAVVVNDALLIDGVRVVEGPRGLLVAMPDVEVMRPCPACRAPNRARATFCDSCGGGMPRTGYVPPRDLYREVVHPVKRSSRRAIEGPVLDAYVEAYRQSARGDLEAD